MQQPRATWPRTAAIAVCASVLSVTAASAVVSAEPGPSQFRVDPHQATLARLAKLDTKVTALRTEVNTVKSTALFTKGYLRTFASGLNDDLRQAFYALSLLTFFPCADHYAPSSCNYESDRIRRAYPYPGP